MRTKALSFFFAFFIVALPALATVTKIDNDTLIKKQVHLDKITVYGKTKRDLVKDAQMSIVSVSPQQIYSTPVFMGEPDVMKALEKFPGVQSSNEGTAGVFVRGGDYDQNCITLDGTPIYHAEHLRGFVGAINPDMVKGINFYRGAFPAQYGSRLSSIIDIGLKEGDMKQFHGLISLGMLSGRLQAEGPLWKDHTSFNIASRMSYFDLMAYPILKKVYTHPTTIETYNNMKYMDVTAKIAHRWNNDSQKLEAVFYYGKDQDKETPEANSSVNNGFGNPSIFHNEQCKITEVKESSMANQWHNLLGSLTWKAKWNNQWTSHSQISFSQYDSKLSYNVMKERQIVDYFREWEYSHNQESQRFRSFINNLSWNALVQYRPSSQHTITTGLHWSTEQLDPNITSTNKKDGHTFNGPLNYDKDSIPDPEYIIHHTDTTLVTGKRSYVHTGAIHAADEWKISDLLHLNTGIRMNVYHVQKKNYYSLEPRASLSIIFSNAISAKLSYARMSQAVRRLVSSNLVMASDIWIPITRDIPIMKSDNFAAGIFWKLPCNIHLSLEGYYKTMNHTVDYMDGASFLAGTGKWQDMVVIGKGRSYGIELLLEKSTDNNTGWLSYTWSKALRTYDRPGQTINGGNEFYANNDRRHNLSANFSHRFRLTPFAHIDLALSWSYLSGRKGTIPTTFLMGYKTTDYDMKQYWDGVFVEGNHQFGIFHADNLYHTYWGGFDNLPLPVTTYKNRNNYQMPDIHHLDMNVTFSFSNAWGLSSIGISLYNIYNRMNVSNVYLGYKNDRYILKGICPFPLMPSIILTHKI